jgi:hypothetical protein
MSGPNKGDGKASDLGLVEVTVAPGRTINKAGPGESVKVSREDAATLRRLGFAVDPEAPVIARGIGPTFSSEEGPKIRVP